MDHFHIALSEDQLRAVSSIGLAHVGDAVYELLVRTWLCANGKLAIDEPFVHEGIVDAPFIGMVKGVEEKNGRTEYLTEITGQARITGFHKFVFADNDDLREGFYFD